MGMMTWPQVTPEGRLVKRASVWLGKFVLVGSWHVPPKQLTVMLIYSLCGCITTLLAHVSRLTRCAVPRPIARPICLVMPWQVHDFALAGDYIVIFVR